MDEIIIGFSHPKAWFVPFAWLICACTKSKFSHAYIAYYNSYADRWTIFQASGMKVNFIGQTLFSSQENILAQFTIQVSETTKQKAVQFAIDSVGLPYGLGQVIGFAWVLLMRAFGKTVRNPFASSSSDFCSELVANALQNVIQPTDNLDPSIMSPQDLYNFLLAKGMTPSVPSA